MPKKLLLILLAGVAMELSWALATMSVQGRNAVGSVLMAVVTPFLSTFVTAATIVDEPRFWPRIWLTAVYALGAAIGMLLALAM